MFSRVTVECVVVLVKCVQEIRVISQCSCPQLTRFITSAMNESRLWIVMEYLEGGSLRNMLDLGSVLCGWVCHCVGLVFTVDACAIGTASTSRKLT